MEKRNKMLITLRDKKKMYSLITQEKTQLSEAYNSLLFIRGIQKEWLPFSLETPENRL